MLYLNGLALSCLTWFLLLLGSLVWPPPGQGGALQKLTLLYSLVIAPYLGFLIFKALFRC